MQYSEADWTLIPLSMHSTLRLYIENGIIPENKFLLAYLQGDLRGALEEALGDENHGSFFFEYGQFLSTFCPAECWGNTKLMLEWHSKGGLRQLTQTGGNRHEMARTK